MSRYRPKNGGTPEVHTARSKLDSALQILRDKKDEQFPAKVMIKEEPLDPSNHSSFVSLPSTSTGRGLKPQSPKAGSSRKRKRPHDGSPPPRLRAAALAGPQFQHTYAVKLFERSVDLAQFREETPLYPVCRAWVENKPYSAKSNRENSPSPESQYYHGLPEDEEDLKQRKVYSLPPPLDTDAPRCPSPVAQPDEHLDIHADPKLAPAPQDLLLAHMKRWRKTRQKWKDHLKKYESKWAPSLRTLKYIYDQAQTDY